MREYHNLDVCLYAFRPAIGLKSMYESLLTLVNFIIQLYNKVIQLYNKIIQLYNNIN